MMTLDQLTYSQVYFMKCIFVIISSIIIVVVVVVVVVVCIINNDKELQTALQVN